MKYWKNWWHKYSNIQHFSHLILNPKNTCWVLVWSDPVQLGNGSDFEWHLKTQQFWQPLSHVTITIWLAWTGSCTMGAQIPNMFGFGMVQSCSVCEWFCFWMVGTFWTPSGIVSVFPVFKRWICRSSLCRVIGYLLNTTEIRCHFFKLMSNWLREIWGK